MYPHDIMRDIPGKPAPPFTYLILESDTDGDGIWHKVLRTAEFNVSVIKVHEEFFSSLDDEFIEVTS